MDNHIEIGPEDTVNYRKITESLVIMEISGPTGPPKEYIEVKTGRTWGDTLYEAITSYGTWKMIITTFIAIIVLMMVNAFISDAVTKTGPCKPIQEIKIGTISQENLKVSPTRYSFQDYLKEKRMN